MRLLNGKFVYETIEDLTYAFLNTMEMSTRPDGTIIDKTIDPNGTVIMVNDKVLKANTDARVQRYAGENDILLDPLTNLHILNTLFGLFIDKYTMTENRNMLSMYTEECLDENRDKMTSYGAKFEDGTIYHSEYYYSRCLGLIELIFLISEENVYVRNFDMTPRQMEKLRKKKAREAEAAKNQKAFTIEPKVEDKI